MRIIKEIFAKDGDGSQNDMLNLMMAFEELLDKGFVEQFTNEYGEIDYRATGRKGTESILFDKKDSSDFD